MHHTDPHLSTELQHTLGDALAHSNTGRLVHRLICVLLVAEGRPAKEVADWLHVDLRSVQRWVHNAYICGVQGLADKPHAGRPSSLNEEQLQATLKLLHESPLVAGYADAHWSGKRLALHLQKTLGVTVSVRSCQRLIAFSRAHAK
jgi:transposase